MSVSKLPVRFAIDRDRSRERVSDAEPQESPTKWLDDAVGRRYQRCTFDNYAVACDAQAKAVAQCRDYVTGFGACVREGVSLLFVGPKGTGKDHLMVATLRAIVNGYRTRPDRRPVCYRDGLSLFAEFRGAINRRAKGEDDLVGFYRFPDLLALSDPLPPVGTLSEYEQRILLRIIDGRYRDCKPIAATLNVFTFDELETRMGPQSADRLRDAAVVVDCQWESYRGKR